MPMVDLPKNGAASALRDEWIQRVSVLVESVKVWAEELGWATRKIEKKLDDPDFGEHTAPALLMQDETTRILLDPIARSAVGTDGVVDLYLMPAYDDIAHLYSQDGVWRVQFQFPGAPAIIDRTTADSRPFSKEALKAVLDEMRKHAQ